MTDFRKLCREMYDAFTAHARTDKQHDLLDRVQIALEEPPTKGSDNPWKDVLEDALVCAFLLNEDNQSDPKKALHDLISWEIQLAKDQLINPPAQSTSIGEPVAWLWEYIGPDPLPFQCSPVARALHEMDPNNPPHPSHWRPVSPLYTLLVTEEVTGPSDDEVEVWADDQGFIRGHGDHPCGFWIDDGDAGAFARAVLARWGRPATVPAEEEEVEVADEVRYLVKELRDQADDLSPSLELFGLIHLAADLLERQAAPVPVPVAVRPRLPGAEDCDAEGRCWWGEPQIEDSHDATWNLCTQTDAEDFLTWGTKCGWLPAHALTLPSVEVEA